MERHSKPRQGGPRRAGKGADNQVRIIGGAWRTRVIRFPDAEGLRPTGNRIRETLFNWLGQTLHDRHCLDLFAGSGALGFEAASRGAASVVMVEAGREAAAALDANAALLGGGQCRVVRGEALAFLARDRGRYDVIFVDPPFASGLMPAVLDAAAPRLADGGVLYAEWGAPLEEVLAGREGWALRKAGRAGAVHFGLLEIPRDSPSEGSP